MPYRFLSTLLAIVFCVVLFPSTSSAQGRGLGKGKQNAERADDDRDRDDQTRHSSPVFTVRDRDIIARFFRGEYGNLPPGLAKRGGNLPPGLQKQLERNGSLPPGLQKRLQPFPAALNRRLGPLPDIYTRGVVGSAAVIIDTRTQRIVDIIHDILHP